MEGKHLMLRSEPQFLGRPACIQVTVPTELSLHRSYVVWKCSLTKCVNKSLRAVMCKWKGRISRSNSQQPEQKEKMHCTSYESAFQSCYCPRLQTWPSSTECALVSSKPRTDGSLERVTQPLPPSKQLKPLTLASSCHAALYFCTCAMQQPSLKKRPVP